MLKYFVIDKNHTAPKFATKNSACFDLSACIAGRKLKFYTRMNESFECSEIIDSIEIPAEMRVLIPTGLILDIPDGYSVRIHARSGLSLKQGLVLANSEGIIDSDYTDELMIMIKNDSLQRVKINHGDRIAQGELVKSIDYSIEECYNRPTQKSDRNGGFGSTGVSI